MRIYFLTILLLSSFSLLSQSCDYTLTGMLTDFHNGSVLTGATIIVAGTKRSFVTDFDGKFIIPECFDYVWMSGDRYETFFDEYIEKLDAQHWDDPRIQKFIINIGTYKGRTNNDKSIPEFLMPTIKEAPIAPIKLRQGVAISNVSIRIKILS